MTAKDIRNIRKGRNLTIGYIQEEIASCEGFIKKIFDERDQREEDPAVVEQLMAELTRRSDSSLVRDIRDWYLYISAFLAAMYIVPNHVSSKKLPPFYDKAMAQAKKVFFKGYGFHQCLVYFIMAIVGEPDVERIIGCMRSVKKCIKRYRRKLHINRYEENFLYQLYEEACFRKAFSIFKDQDVTWEEKRRLFRCLTELKNRKSRMLAYAYLFHLHVNRFAESKNGDVWDFNNASGNYYFEEYLVKAYTTPGYSLENLDLEYFCDDRWLACAVEYANFMYLGNLSSIPHDPEEAMRILEYAATAENEEISQRAKLFLNEIENNRGGKDTAPIQARGDV